MVPPGAFKAVAAMAGLPSACFCCGATAATLSRRTKPVRVRPLSEEAAAGLVLQQEEAALARAATHALDVICGVCYSLNRRLEEAAKGHAGGPLLRWKAAARELASLSRSPSPPMRSRPAEGAMEEEALAALQLAAAAGRSRGRVYSPAEWAAVGAMRADPAREPDQDVCHLLAYSKGGASTPENLALGGSKLNRAVGANSLGPMAAMLGAVTAPGSGPLHALQARAPRQDGGAGGGSQAPEALGGPGQPPRVWAPVGPRCRRRRGGSCPPAPVHSDC